MIVIGAVMNRPAYLNAFMILFLLLHCVMPLPILAQDTSDTLQKSPEQPVITQDSSAQLQADSGRVTPVHDNNAFIVGEKLSFKIRYGFITAGSSEMRVLERRKRDGRDILFLQTRAKSNGTFDWIYKVRDEVNTHIDYNGLFPYHYAKKLREGGYKADLFTDYNHADSLAYVEFIRYKDDDEIKKHEKNDTKISPFIHNVLSALYFMRTRDIEVGKSRYVKVLEKTKIYDLEIRIYRREVIEVDAGKFRCIVVEPLLKGEGIFKHEGRLTIWFSDDHLKIPVQMTSKVLVGHITVELTNIEGIKDKIPAQLD